MATSSVVHPTPGDRATSTRPTGVAILTRLCAAHQDASASRHALALAGQRFEVFFSSSKLADLYMPALARLEASDAVAGSSAPGDDGHGSGIVRVLVFDRGGGDDDTFAEQVRSTLPAPLLAPPVHARFQIDGPEPTRTWALTFFDPDEGVAAVWVDSLESIPSWETHAPLLRVWHATLARRDRCVTHAAAVGDEDGGVLLAGPGGSGKSTTTLAAILGGMRCVGEDYVIIDLAPEVIEAYALYNNIKLSPSVRDLMPELPDALQQAPALGMDKVIARIDDIRAGAQVSRLPLQAVVIPRLGAADCRLTPCSSADALRALAPSTIFQLSGDGGGAFGPLSQVVRRLPCYYLDLSSDPRAAVPTLKELLRHAAD
jgi:hypothetical protein